MGILGKNEYIETIESLVKIKARESLIIVLHMQNQTDMDWSKFKISRILAIITLLYHLDIAIGQSKCLFNYLFNIIDNIDICFLYCANPTLLRSNFCVSGNKDNLISVRKTLNKLKSFNGDFIKFWLIFYLF
ncbi:unnamed protein product [Blepharisma stoltei]|uniref:Uncharacterized protein n=1 Tax=Blepharisma stoltei TaxID=1481888 RepID=A0AAU9JT38_9CILI|nr:unnamed protein product [Blepharisma stoltei]